MAFGRGSPPPPAPPSEASAPQVAEQPVGPGLTHDDLVAAVNGIAKRIYNHTDGPSENVNPQWIFAQLAHAADLLRWIPMRTANANSGAGSSPPPKSKAN